MTQVLFFIILTVLLTELSVNRITSFSSLGNPRKNIILKYFARNSLGNEGT